MKLAVHVLAYNVDRFLRPMLENVGPWVDKIYIAYPTRPFAYIASSREAKTNPTLLKDLIPDELRSKIEVIYGDWTYEEDTRNACLDRARSEGFDWLIIQDADEFYSEASWKKLRRQLAIHPGVEAFLTTWYTFWKSSHYVIEERHGGIKGANVGFAIRCLPHLNFVKRRVLNVTHPSVIDAPCYHYGYVMSDDEMREKLTTWSHAHEVDVQTWFKRKWLGWRLATRNLNPTYPVAWRRAIRFPFEQPDFAQQFALEHIEPSHPSFANLASEWVDNVRVETYERIREVKRSLE